MYIEITLNEAFKGFKVHDDKKLEKLSRINVLIGKNNAGKSRFMRALFHHESFDVKTENHFLLKKAREQFEKAVKGLKNHWEHSDYAHQISELEQIALLAEKNNLPNLNDIRIALEQVDMKLSADVGLGPKLLASFNNEARLMIKLIKERIKEKYKHIYVPILRGLRPVQLVGDLFDTKSDVYLKRTVKDYFKGDLDSKLIVSGLGLYEETKRLLLGRIGERRKVQAFEKFISETFFEGKEFSIVPHVEDDVIYVRIGSAENDEKPIHELGDGIQAIIILLYPLFFHQGETCVICFEEPETHLHPGLQRLFIETLRREKFSTFQYFLTTHSNHFLDLTADYDDIAVYSFKKDDADTKSETFVVENVENGEGSVLQELGVRASSVFLSNCTIWVEGITDRLYLRKYLEIYQKSRGGKHFKEDYHYSFIEYGGNNITHWSFLESADSAHSNINVDRICKKIFLITDKDGAGLTKNGNAPAGKATSNKKYKRHQLLAEKLGDQYFCLECREIENLLTKETIKKVVQEKEGQNPDLDFKAFDKADYNTERLGSFITKRVIGVKKKYAADSGTIHDKLNFCKIAIRNINDMDDLSDEAKKLCEKLYNFILEANSL